MKHEKYLQCTNKESSKHKGVSLFIRGLPKHLGVSLFAYFKSGPLLAFSHLEANKGRVLRGGVGLETSHER